MQDILKIVHKNKMARSQQTPLVINQFNSCEYCNKHMKLHHYIKANV